MTDSPAFNWGNRAFKFLTSTESYMQQSMFVYVCNVFYSQSSLNLHVLVIWGIDLRADTPLVPALF